MPPPRPGHPPVMRTMVAATDSWTDPDGFRTPAGEVHAWLLGTNQTLCGVPVEKARLGRFSHVEWADVQPATGRDADRVTSASLAQLVNVIAPIMTEPGGPAWRQTTFFPFAITSRLAVGEALDVKLTSDTYQTAIYGEVPLVDAVATHDAETGRTAIFVVNRSLDAATTVQVDVSHLGAVEVGMLRALLERGIVPDLVVGTSVGALNGALVARQPELAVVDRLTGLWASTARSRDVYGDRPLRTVRRAVTTTECPASSAARAISRPIPVEHPVTNQRLTSDRPFR